MVRKCIICKKLELVGENASFHRFPLNSEERNIWCSLVGIEVETVSYTSRLCSDHFNIDDILTRSNGNKYLKPGATPFIMHSVFQSESWDEWVPESRALKYNEANIAKQKEVQKAPLAQQSKTKKAAKKSSINKNLSVKGSDDSRASTLVAEVIDNDMTYDVNVKMDNKRKGYENAVEIKEETLWVGSPNLLNLITNQPEEIQEFLPNIKLKQELSDDEFIEDFDEAHTTSSISSLMTTENIKREFKQDQTRSEFINYECDLPSLKEKDEPEAGPKVDIKNH